LERETPFFGTPDVALCQEWQLLGKVLDDSESGATIKPIFVL
jgi:hypothetical protein